MEPKPRCLGSIFVSIYRVTKGRDCNRSTQVFGKLATLSLPSPRLEPRIQRGDLRPQPRLPHHWLFVQSISEHAIGSPLAPSCERRNLEPRAPARCLPRPRVGLESAGLNLAELPPEVVSDVIGFYKFMGHLEKVFDGYQRATETIAAIEDRSSLIGREAITNKRNAVDQFKKSIEEAIRWCDTAMERLGTIADDPDWRQWVEDREAMIEHDPSLERTPAPTLRPPPRPGG
jgi:hypothetical protein